MKSIVIIAGLCVTLATSAAVQQVVVQPDKETYFLLQVCIERLGEGSPRTNLAVFEHLLIPLQTGNVRSNPVGIDWREEAPRLKTAWRQFLTAHREAIVAGEKFPLGKEPVVPAMIPPGMQFRVDRQAWPP